MFFATVDCVHIELKVGKRSRKRRRKKYKLSGSVCFFPSLQSLVRNPYDFIVPLHSAASRWYFSCIWISLRNCFYANNRVRRARGRMRRTKRVDMILVFVLQHFACSSTHVHTSVASEIFKRKSIKVKITRALWNFYLYIIQNRFQQWMSSRH